MWSRLARRGWLVVCGLCLFVPALAAQGAGTQGKAAGTEQRLRQLENEWGQAFVKKDAAKLGGILADDWVGIDFSGKSVTKAEALNDLKSGASSAVSVDLTGIKVRVFGDTAVVTGVSTEKSTYKGKDSSGQYVWTDVFVNRGGEWRAVASHSTKTK